MVTILRQSLAYGHHISYILPEFIQRLYILQQKDIKQANINLEKRKV